MAWTRVKPVSEVQKQENRGGARPGAGRKPAVKASLSTYQVAKMLRKAKKMAKLRGKDLDDILLDICYDANIRKSEVLAAIKVFKDCTMVRPSEGGEADKTLGPAVFLPQHRPTLSVVESKKTA